MKKNVFRVLAATAMIPCLMGTAFAAEKNMLPYEDVTESAWYYEAVEDLYAGKILLGVNETQFAPAEGITLEDFNMALFMLGSGAESQDAEAARNWSVSSGILAADSDFSVVMTREDTAVLLQKFLLNCGVNIPATLNIPPEYADHDKISPHAVDAVQFMQNVRLLQGYADGTFRPQQAITRAEAASILDRLADSCETLPLIISLPGNATTGYRWQVGSYNDEIVWVEELPYVATEADGMVGVGGAYRFAVYGFSAGQTSLSFYYSRPGSGSAQPADETHITVLVEENGKVVQLSR